MRSISLELLTCYGAFRKVRSFGCVHGTPAGRARPHFFAVRRARFHCFFPRGINKTLETKNNIVDDQLCGSHFRLLHGMFAAICAVVSAASPKNTPPHLIIALVDDLGTPSPAPRPNSFQYIPTNLTVTHELGYNNVGWNNPLQVSP